MSPAKNLISVMLALLLGAFFQASAATCLDKGELSPNEMRAIVLYEEGWGGSNSALMVSLELLEELINSPDRTPLMDAYHGSACIARARMVPDRQKPQWLRRGAAELDRAVAAEPENPQIRLIRAVSFAVLPRLAGRMDTAEDDFNWLVTRAKEDSNFPSVCRQAIFYHAGVFAMRNRDPRALDWLEQAAKLNPAYGGIGPERVNRMLRLAREQVPPEDE